MSAVPSVADTTDISFYETSCPEPPKDTFAHDLWDEEGSSRKLLQCIGRSAVFEKLTENIDEAVVGRLADGLHSSKV